MLPLKVCLFSLLFTTWSVSCGTIIFEDSANVGSEQQPTNTDDTSNVGTRNGLLSDSISVEAAGTPPSGEPDGRFFGLLGGSGLLGGLGLNHGHGAGYPYGGGYGAGVGGSKPGRCPGVLGLGFGQPEGGYGGYPPYGGAGLYNNAYRPGYGGNHFGLHHPGAAYAPLGGYNGFGFRSASESSGSDAEANAGSRRRRSDEVASETAAAEQSTDGDSAVQGRALANDGQTDPRLLGLFGKSCFYDFHCPGQFKCCAGVLGHKATCQQPALFG